MIGNNSLLPTQVGTDIAGTDYDKGVLAEQLTIKEILPGVNGIECKYQPQSIIGNIYVYNATTGALEHTLLRQTIQAYHQVKLSQGAIGQIAWIQYRF